MPALRGSLRSLRRTYEHASLGGALRALALSLLRSRREGQIGPAPALRCAATFNNDCY
jgi:hypothetical protein